MPAGSAFTVTVTEVLQPAPTEYVITVVPGSKPLTIPVLPTVAIVGALLLQVPPGTMSESVVVLPTQTRNTPVRDAGELLTVITFVAVQPVLVTLYVIVATPAIPPATIPVVAPTGAITDELDDQVPPIVASVRGVVKPTQTEPEPTIAAGEELTVMSFLAEHPATV
jgi:hypothetical protein